jgi:CDP-diacylglycerol--glycerol-3-phosphate 3-phosphatidyltransferase
MARTGRKLFIINLVTGSRLALALPVAILTPWSKDQPWAVIASAALIAGIELTDLLDGFLARRHDSVSPFGKMFDPYADSISRLIVYWSLAVVGRCLLYVPLVMAIRDVTVAYSRLIMSRRGMDVSARHTGKLKAAVQGASAPVLMALPFFVPEVSAYVIGGLSAAVLAITVASMVDYGWAALAEPAESSRDQ